MCLQRAIRGHGCQWLSAVAVSIVCLAARAEHEALPSPVVVLNDGSRQIDGIQELAIDRDACSARFA